MRGDRPNPASQQLAFDLGCAGTLRPCAFHGLVWPGQRTKEGGRLVYCALDDVDSLYERVRESGGDIAVEITETDYGSRDFTVCDPEGNLWAFGTYRPHVGER
jgi:hypothetical protein